MASMLIKERRFTNRRFGWVGDLEIAAPWLGAWHKRLYIRTEI
jgi:hypothetical protein